MFKIVASFTRKNLDHKFFNDICMNNDIVKEVLKSAEKIPGYLGIDEYVYRDKFRCDKALCFDNEKSAYEFAQCSKILLDKRMELINDYCHRTGHEYKDYIILNKE